MASSSMTSTDPTLTAVEHCEAMGRIFPELADKYYHPMAQYRQDKLWHQLTVCILDFVKDPAAAKTIPDSGIHTYQAVYDTVLLSGSINKYNPLSVAQIASAVANALAPTDMTAAKAVLENLLSKQQQPSEEGGAAAAASGTGGGMSISSNNSPNSVAITMATTVPATIFTESQLALLQLQSVPAEILALAAQPSTTVDTSSITTASTPTNTTTTTTPSAEVLIMAREILQHCKDTIKKNASKLETLSLTKNEAAVPAAHYQHAMTYYKTVGPAEAFYEQAMQFLNYAPPDSGVLVVDLNYTELAVGLVLAALTGEGVYNLGQVEQTPVLAVLKDHPAYGFLAVLLQATAAGDVLAFQAACQQYATQIQQQPALVHRAAVVQEKVTLLAVVHYMATKKTSSEQTVTLQELHEHAVHKIVTLDQMEWVCMRLFRIPLAAGSMDQVAGTVSFTWLLPRVLPPTQLQAIADIFGSWSDKVSKTRSDILQQWSHHPHHNNNNKSMPQQQ